MKKSLLTLALALSFIVLTPAQALATPVSWDFAGNILQPLSSGKTAEVKVPYITATSTTATSTLLNTNIQGAGVSILGEYFTNFTTYVRSLFTGGTGITISSGAVSVDFTEFDTDDITEGATNTFNPFGASIDTGEITDDTILEVDLDATNSATDNQILSYDQASGGFTWVNDATGSGSGSISTSTPLADGEIIYATGVDTIGSESAFAYDATLNKITVINASTTALTISDLSSELLKVDAGGTVLEAIAGTDYELPLTFTYPIQRSVNTISLAFGTTTANTWSLGQTFTSGLISNAYSTFTDLFATNATTTNATTTGAVNFSSFTSALLQVDATGDVEEYAGTSCTNQFVRSLSALGIATCATVANTDLANSTVSYGGITLSLGGSDATPAFNLADATGLPISTGVSGLGTGIATALGINTGSAGAPILFNGAGGTPSSLTLTNATGLPVSTGISGLGSGVATWLATPSSANLATAVTGETGSGALVFGTSPTFTTSALSPIWSSTAADPADAGVFRLGNAEVIGWEASPAGTDVTLTVNTSEVLVLAGGGFTATGGTATFGTLGGALDAGGATSFEIPNGTAPTVDAIGEIALDTTDNQFLLASSTNASFPLVIPTRARLFGASIASTSPDFVSGGRIPVPNFPDGFTMTQFDCFVDGGTSVVFNVSNFAGTADTETITCDADGAVDTSIGTNPTVTAGTLMSIEIGTITGSVDYLNFVVSGYWTRE